MKKPLFKPVGIYDFAGQPLTLFQFNNLLKDVLADGFPASYWIVAEISKVTERGHCYLELVEKDDAGTHAQARGTIWSNKYRKIAQHFEARTGQSIRPGLKILFNASLQYHEVYGLSLDIHEVDPTYTVGELARLRQDIIDRLEKEGLLFKNGALALPTVPQRIAVVSSPTAAGYQDFMHQIGVNVYRYQFTCVLFPALMQGNDAPASVVEALRQIGERAAEFDVAIVIRGGGSQNDLSCFDHYGIAATLAGLPLPVLTGIGHERDETITDLAAHTRLKTPTAVAAFLIETCRHFEETLENAFQELATAAVDQLTVAREYLERQSLVLCHRAESNLNQHHQRLNRHQYALRRQAERQTDRQEAHLEQLTEKMKCTIQNRLLREQTQLDFHALKISLLDPVALLKRGLSRTYHNGQLITSVGQLQKDDVIETQLGDGRVRSVVTVFNQLQ